MTPGTLATQVPQPLRWCCSRPRSRRQLRPAGRRRRRPPRPRTRTPTRSRDEKSDGGDGKSGQNKSGQNKSGQNKSGQKKSSPKSEQGKANQARSEAAGDTDEKDDSDDADDDGSGDGARRRRRRGGRRRRKPSDGEGDDGSDSGDDNGRGLGRLRGLRGRQRRRLPPASSSASLGRRLRQRRWLERRQQPAGAPAQPRGRDHQHRRLHPPRGQEAAPARGPRGRPSSRADRQRGRVPGPSRVRRPGHGHPAEGRPDPDRRTRGQGARRALRRPRVADLADRQRLPRSGAERAALDGGGLHRHRQGPQRGALRRRGQLVGGRPQGRPAAQDRVGAVLGADRSWCRSPRTRSVTRAPG